MISAYHDTGAPIVVTGVRLVTGYLGYSLIFAGVIVLSPLVVLPIWTDETVYALCFIIPGITSMLIGYLIYFMTLRGQEYGKLQKNEDSIIITGAWVIAVAVLCVPFVLEGNHTISQAVFETTSGLTTTGLTVVDVASCPKIFLLHRSLTHFFGGIGLVLVLVTLVSDGGVFRVYSAEGHTDQLLPSMSGSARLILALYVGIIVMGIILYCTAGMPLFDAVNTSISAVSTGGFAVQPDSIGAYHSTAIEAISILLMVMGGTNFLLTYMFVQGKFKAFFSHSETKLYYATILVFSLVVGLIFYTSSNADDIGNALFTSLFHVVSVVTTTGFQTIPSFAALPPAILFLFMLLMFMGAGAGSTTGAIKMYRVVVTFKGLGWALRDKFGKHRSIYSHNINRFGLRLECTREEQWSVFVFVLLYLSLFIIGTFIFTLYGNSVQDSAFDFASCLGNVGVSVGVVTADSPAIILWTGTIGMLLGRLEIIVVFLAIAKLISQAKQHNKTFARAAQRKGHIDEMAA